MKINFMGLWLLPSFYGLLAWSTALIILILDIVHVNSISLEGWMVIGYVLIVFVAMSAAFIVRASRVLKRNYIIEVHKRDWIIFVIATLLGVAGLLKYVYDFSLIFGGFRGFFVVLFSSSLDIRSAAAETLSIGFQLSYFSWISIFFGLYFLIKTKMLFIFRVSVTLFVALEILLNLTFIDRTRPTWLFVVCVLGIYFSSGTHGLRIWRPLFFIGVFPLILFVLFSLGVGKYNADAGIYHTMLAYVVSGFGYLDSIISVGGTYDYLPIRTFYPISKVLESYGFIASIPSPVLANRNIPFETNVGTFVEPLLSDGGILFVLIGVPLVIFVVNYLSLKSFSSKSLFGLFVWSNLIFCMLISFFVPKFNSTSIYLFCSLFALLQILSLKSRRHFN